MKNRDSNENIYRNLEKCYALLQVHIFFSFHTLIYIISLNRCKYTEFSRNIRGKSWKICGKSFHFFPFHSSTSCRMTRFRGRFRSFSVVFGRFCGHFWRKTENFGEKWRISENLVEFSRKSFLFIPFLSSIPRFCALQHVFETILSEE